MQQYWYVLVNDSQVGPLTMEEVRNMSLTPATMVWREGMSQWMPAAQVPEFSDLFCNTQTPPPPHANAGGYGYQQQFYGQPGNNYYVSQSGKDKTAAGILAILLGGLGVQYFYLGKIGAGFLTIILTLITCGLWEILMIVQGVLMLTMSQQEFDTKFVYSDSTLPLF